MTRDFARRAEARPPSRPSGSRTVREEDPWQTDAPTSAQGPFFLRDKVESWQQRDIAGLDPVEIYGGQKVLQLLLRPHMSNYDVSLGVSLDVGYLDTSARAPDVCVCKGDDANGSFTLGKHLIYTDLLPNKDSLATPQLADVLCASVTYSFTLK
jgi:hypothetical protein